MYAISDRIVMKTKRKRVTRIENIKRGTENQSEILCSVKILLVNTVLHKALARKVGYSNSKPPKSGKDVMLVALSFAHAFQV